MQLQGPCFVAVLALPICRASFRVAFQAQNRVCPTVDQLRDYMRGLPIIISISGAMSSVALRPILKQVAKA